VPRKKTRLPGAEIDPAFRPIVGAFAHHRDVTGGKMMSSYGLKVNGKIFAMFGRKLPNFRRHVWMNLWLPASVNISTPVMAVS